ncbi:transcriptional regulator, XRE family [Desulfofarcimen acetoxidans DSM 771]|uniref:Transcriptional regulator, XRE family n=1 Tax=Desulfofarcimen acetoxidans (strain ATCC 49208 / DSM 771 / KCTC 5769 / VKM B-1644 / 5575) TaxID=485916 RepID=C8VY64_DESAS|nr:XRE family transcriptional regulator [Desulfofarcimen acetoxidans]ACV64693.1 transcriptional regulator, XRE family [Desulfofarcimen acetoxidans DSM 771]
MNIGIRIRELRKNSNINITQLAIKVGISRVYLSELERNIKTPPLETLERICSALNITLVDFFTENTLETICNNNYFNESTVPYKNIPDDIKSIIKESQKLNSSQLSIIKNLIKEITSQKLNGKYLEILDVLENNTIIVTVSGKPLELKNKIKLLEFLKNDFNTVDSKNDFTDKQDEKKYDK